MSTLCAVFRYSSFHKEFAQLQVTCLFEALRYPEYCLSVLILTTVFVYCTSVYILEMLEDSSSHDKCIILDRLEDKQSISAQCQPSYFIQFEFLCTILIHFYFVLKYVLCSELVNKNKRKLLDILLHCGKTLFCLVLFKKKNKRNVLDEQFGHFVIYRNNSQMPRSNKHCISSKFLVDYHIKLPDCYCKEKIIMNCCTGLSLGGIMQFSSQQPIWCCVLDW